MARGVAAPAEAEGGEYCDGRAEDSVAIGESSTVEKYTEVGVLVLGLNGAGGLVWMVKR